MHAFVCVMLCILVPNPSLGWRQDKCETESCAIASSSLNRGAAFSLSVSLRVSLLSIQYVESFIVSCEKRTNKHIHTLFSNVLNSTSGTHSHLVMSIRDRHMETNEIHSLSLRQMVGMERQVCVYITQLGFTTKVYDEGWTRVKLNNHVP